MTSPRKIALCTAIHRHTTADFTASLLKTHRALQDKVPLFWLNVTGEPNVAHARNILVAESLKRGATDIVFIDDDIGWEPEALLQLFNVPEACQIVAGAPQRRQRENVSFCSTIEQDPKRNGHLFSGYAATAFLRIAASVFHELRYPAEYHYPNGTCRSWFFHDIAQLTETAPKGFIASDYYFSKKCKEEGIEVWIDPEIPLRHHASVALTACMADFMKS